VCGNVSCPGSHWDWVELGRISVKEMSSPLLPLRLVYLVISFYLLTQVGVITGIDCAGSAYQLQMTAAYIL
jgi:hypothetical protein